MEGLTREEVGRRLGQYGPNVLPEKRQFLAAAIFLHQFTSPLIFVLLAAVAITLVLGDMVDAAVIGGAVVMNTILGFIQEYKAETSLAALKSILTPQAKVIRDGKTVTITAMELVPGDVVILTAGDRVPGDGRVVEAVSLFINEAMITGESVPVEKYNPTNPTNNQIRPMNESMTQWGNNKNESIVFMGTVVATGRGKMEVTATGADTAIGRMATTLTQTKKEDTPLQKEIGRLARNLAIVVLVLCSLLFFLGLYYGKEITLMLTTAVAIAVSAIPEGLVVSLTVILALGMQRVMKRKALVRRMVAAETLGSVSTICVDKTGTITQGVMQVVREDVTDPGVAVKAAIFANNLEDPLEIALWDWARGQDHIDPQKMVDESKRLGEIPFDSRKKYMSVTTPEGVWVKGAPEVVLGMSTLTKSQRNEWLRKVTAWGGEGLRVLGLGYRMENNPTNPTNKQIRPMNDEMEQQDNETMNVKKLTFLGLIGIADPVREGVGEAVVRVRNAGVTVVMVTGDYRATAEAVLGTIGLPITNPEREIMEGSELAAISESELAVRVREIRLFCRVSPDQKHKIVSALQTAGEVVAMTGDGVNDALAIKKADIGIVVEGASDVARETADIVLLDSNFRTIVGAIEEGRAIFDNIRKVTLYLLSDAFVEMGIIAGAIVLGWPLPLTALQILWINLVDDGLPSIALTVDPAAGGLMTRAPRPRTMLIVDTRMNLIILVVCIATTILSLGIFTWVRGSYLLATAQTTVFTLVASVSFLYVFSFRRLDSRLRVGELLQNRWLLGSVAAGFILQLFAVYHPWGNHAFGTVPLPLFAWGVIFSASAVIIGMIEGIKRIRPIRPISKSDQ